MSRDQSVEDEQLGENEPEDQDGDLVGPPETTCRPDHNHTAARSSGASTLFLMYLYLFISQGECRERSLLL